LATSSLELLAENNGDYEYLDSGNGRRLERFGPHVLSRPSTVALWAPERPGLWEKADGTFHRSSGGNGRWIFAGKVPRSWEIQAGGFTVEIKPTSFGHVGLFHEHSCHWSWVRSQVGKSCSVLHLFGYTGAMSLLAARHGAEVCHVDSVSDVNEWARRNAVLSGLEDAAIRWITDDAVKFVARELRRKRRYDAIILDPPTYGNGPKGEKWILEKHLAELLAMLLQLMSDKPRFLLLTCHTTGLSAPVMRNMLLPWMAQYSGVLESGAMLLGNANVKSVLPAGFFARWAGKPV
jgi:23S rRNA (cytosine1962-C5)-methyltransferase